MQMSGRQILYEGPVHVKSSGGSRGGAPPLFWVKKEEMTEGKMADRTSKSRPPPPLSSRSGSATEENNVKAYMTQSI